MLAICIDTYSSKALKRMKAPFQLVWFALLPTLTSCAATAAAVPESSTNECGAVQGQDYNGAPSV